MISLFLNTSSKYLNISIIKEGKELKKIYKELDKDMSKEALYEISKLLEKENIKIKEINEIVCVRGPGSFTGLRVGVTIAKILAHFLKIRLYSTSSLEVMATTTKDEIIVPLIDARRGYVYSAIYDKEYKPLMEEQYIKCEELLEKVNHYCKSTTFISDDEFSFDTLKVNPNIEQVYKYNLKKEENPMTFEPNYLKKTEAEEKLNDHRN